MDVNVPMSGHATFLMAVAALWQYASTPPGLFSAFVCKDTVEQVWALMVVFRVEVEVKAQSFRIPTNRWWSHLVCHLLVQMEGT